MLTRTLLAAATATATLAFAGTATAATHWVNDNGVAAPPGSSCSHPGYNQIQPAVDAASSGDTIRVCAGTYAGDVVVNAPLTLKGPKAGVDARSRSTSGEANVSGVSSGFDLQADNIVLNGFRIRNTTGGPGIYMRPDHSGYQILNNIVQNNVFGIYANSGPGTQSLIRRNLIKGNNQDGAAAGNGVYTDQGTQDLLIKNNSIKSQLNAGILMTSSGSAFNDNNTIRSNRGVNNTTFVNLFGDNRHLLITSNSSNDTVNADDPDQGCVIRVDEDASWITIAYNTLRNPPFAGVCLRGGDNLDVRNNRIRNSEDLGIDSTDSVVGAALVRGNRVTDGGGAGIQFGSGTSGNTIRNNTALRNSPDCNDASVGTGTAGTANFWTNDIGRTAVPPGICRRPS